MRLVDLEPRFLRSAPDRPGVRAASAFADSTHLVFLCPKCFAKNSGATGTHSISLPIRGAPQAWQTDGTGAEDLTLSPSILLSRPTIAEGGCEWHGWIRAGEIVNA